MFQKKTPKSEEAYRSIYVAHNPHTVPLTNRKWPNRIRIVSVDPGVTHFAIRVEERNIKHNDVITTLFYDKVGLKKEEQELDNDNVSKIFTFIQDFLDKNKELFKTCHIILIEKQLPINYRATRMSQHVLTYFMVLLKNELTLPCFLEVSPTLKGKQLGSPPNINERGLKQWAIEKGTELLTMRNDKVGLQVLQRKINGRKEKKDDLADTILQIEAIFSYFGWPITQKIVTLNIKPTIIKPPRLSIIN